MEAERKNVCIVGGGLVGSLCACFIAKRGYNVDLFEMRQDFRADATVLGRSINLALSHRGLEALERVGLREKVTKSGIPMHARMIHSLDGKTRPIPYGRTGQFIMSVDRMGLNGVLLTEVESQPNITIHFGHKLVSCDPTTGETVFSTDDSTVKRTYDLIVGCDGAFSAVRKSMMRHCRFDYEQRYIEHGYMEIAFPPSESGGHCMATNYLHIWPRNQFMLIALPNLDGSFTGTMFMPFELFDQLKSPEAVVKFYRDTFPDALELLGEKTVVDTILSLKALPLVSIRCQPYHLNDKMLIIGDAAHAMVPFYGQGMNCGFEDCIILDDLMQQFGHDFGKVLPAFTNSRVEDAHAIVDLALYNYIEMRQSVNSVTFLLRKKLDNALNWLLPNHWVPLYTMVTFSRTPYSRAITDRRWQDRVLGRLLCAAAVAASVCAACAAHRVGVTRALRTHWSQMAFRASRMIEGLRKA
ncbi:hypothetical protein BOX15_Mlig010723g3 [Macrostomum lignano]|uniref:Kynurenine 3-monooxygenase n=2 Tax=Macrostomum lignano TaxID=282301 RepID=A0A267G5R9_9PLAT|nr:hypothetical protein BOX15_Mlig010723g3 [Macrostomum lignano]